VRKVLKEIREGYRYAVDIDLEKLFDTVDHDVLMSRVSRRVRDRGLLRLIGRYLRCGVIGELIKLGSARYQAILTGLSRKSYWHLAKTLSTNMGLSKAFLEKQGLVFIRTLWIQIHYPAKAR